MKPATPSQWEAIRAFDRHVLVAAGAGTGKTSTVVGRILYLLGVEIEGVRCPVRLALRDIGAITYTNAAAADLKKKLREELRDIGLRDVSYEVDAARIGTIHSFCGDILREFALRAGRSPGLQVLEEGDGRALIAGAVHDTVLHVLEEAETTWANGSGLHELFSVWSVAEVEGWLRRLVSESARLDCIAAERVALGAQERTILDLAAAAREELGRRLHALGAVDFDRMIVWTRDLLRTDPMVRRALQRRLKVLIVDEFQDVDPVQKEIAYLLGEPESERADTTRLMLVGDPKQSIYRFRRADVTVWRAVQDDFEHRKLGAVVPLADNFRSVEPILAFVDATVGRILNRPIAGDALRDYEVPFQPVAATRPSAGGEPAVELLFVVPERGEKPRVEAIRSAEAEAVARRAWELHRAGVEWRDMAMLLSSWTSLDVYESALRRAGIPTYALRTEGFFERREILDLTLALETLRDPRDDRALVGFLRSPFVGLKDETLLRVARQVTQPYWDRLHETQVGEQELFQWALALLREHVALRDRIPADRLLESLLERSGYLAHLYAFGPDGDQALANVRKFVGLARRVPEHGIGDFLRMIKETRERGDREGDARLYGHGENVLVITSVHSAKGLEWPVVFWCDLIRKASGDRGDGLLIGRDRIVLKNPEVDLANQSLPWRALQQEETAEQLAERKRLWYVAATRAKDRLILSGFSTGKLDEHCPAAAMLAELGDVPAVEGATVAYVGQGGKAFEAVVRTVPCEMPSETSEASEAAAEANGFESRALPELIPPLSAPPGRARHSATELMVYARCAQRHWFRYIAGLKEPPVDRAGPDFLSAIARGQIVHDVLEHAEEEAELDARLEAAIGRWDPDAPAPEGTPGRRYRDVLRSDIESVLGDPAYRALADRPTARRELGFLHILSPDQFTEGRIDLVAREDGGLSVVDVKTGDGDAEAVKRKAEAYAVQRDVYVAALEDISGIPVARFAFQFTGAGGQVSPSATDAKLEDLLRRMAEDRPTLTQNPTECRFCGYKRVGWCGGAERR